MTTIKTESNQDGQSEERGSNMAGRIGKKVQTALIGAILAGGLLLATPLVTDAGGPGPEGCPFDWTGDGMVRMDDIMASVEAYGTDGHTIYDIIGTVQAYGTDC